MIEMEIRPIQKKEAPEICELCHQLGYWTEITEISDRIEDLFRDSDHMAQVALSHGRVIGWIHAACRLNLESGWFVEVVGLVVDEHYRGQGVGTKLVEATKRWARERNQKTVRVRTRDSRTRTHLFYEGRGFKWSKTQRVYEIRIEAG